MYVSVCVCAYSQGHAGARKHERDSPRSVPRAHFVAAGTPHKRREEPQGCRNVYCTFPLACTRILPLLSSFAYSLLDPIALSPRTAQHCTASEKGRKGRKEGREERKDAHLPALVPASTTAVKPVQLLLRLDRILPTPSNTAQSVVGLLELMMQGRLRRAVREGDQAGQGTDGGEAPPSSSSSVATAPPTATTSSRQHGLIQRPWADVRDAWRKVVRGRSGGGRLDDDNDDQDAVVGGQQSEGSTSAPALDSPPSAAELRAFVLVVSVYGCDFSRQQAETLLRCNREVVLAAGGGSGGETDGPRNLQHTTTIVTNTNDATSATTIKRPPLSSSTAQSPSDPLPPFPRSQLKKLGTRRNYWSRLKKMLEERHGSDALGEAVIKAVGHFLLSLRLQEEEDEPKGREEAGATEQERQQDNEMGEGRDSVAAVTPAIADTLPRSPPRTLQSITVEETIDALPEPTIAWGLTSNSVCPGCKRDCVSYPELLFHCARRPFGGGGLDSGPTAAHGPGSSWTIRWTPSVVGKGRCAMCYVRVAE